MSKHCEIPNCNNVVLSEETKNKRFSNRFCKEHISGVDTECSICHKKLHSRTADYMKYITTNKPIVCQQCSLSRHNKSDKMRNNAINAYSKNKNTVKSQCAQCDCEIKVSKNLINKNVCCSDACRTIYDFNNKIQFEDIKSVLKYRNFYRLITFPIEEKHYRIDYKRVCSICGRNFIGAASNSSCCGYCKIQYKCPDCGIWYDTKSRYINERHGQIYRCDRCSRKHNTIKWNKSEKCKEWKQSESWVEHSKQIMNDWNSSNEGKKHNKELLKQNHENWAKSEENKKLLKQYIQTEEHKQWLKEHINKINSNIENRKSFGKCIICNKEDNLYNNRCKTCISKSNFIGIKFCNICNEDTYHIGNRCYKCNPWGTDTLLKGLELKFCEICNKETYHAGNRCSICNPWDFNNIIYERDDFGRIIKIKDISWDDYIKDYIISNSSDFSDFHRINVDISESHPTLPTLAWQQLITDKCSELDEGHWLVYIKYYLDAEGCSRPLVIGKTGDNFVNASGTDLCFNYIDQNQGAARQFLEENNFKWSTEFIDFKCFETEEEALIYEAELLEQTGLFGG